MKVSILVKDESSSVGESVFVRQFCAHIAHGGECIKCRIVIDEDDSHIDS